MGFGIPQVITDKSGAQVIDGSLRFDKNNYQFLQKTFSSAGNRRTWTYSAWFKRGTSPSSNNLWAAHNNTYTGLDNFGQNYWNAADGRFVLFQDNGAQFTSNGRHRDHTGGWYHIVIACDVTQGSYADRYKVYVNNVLNTSSSGTIAQNVKLAFNNNIKHYIGTHDGGASELLDGNLSQVYFIDGQALGPENFGFTDPLTNTWRPKKFSGSFTGPGDNVDDWIGMTTGTPFNASTSIDEAFDGVSNSFAAATGNSYFTFTPTTPITGITNVRLTVQRDNSTSSTIELNDENISSSWSAGTTAAVTFARTTLSKVKWGTDGSNQWFSLGKIEVEKNGVYYTLIHGNVNGFYLPLDGNTPIGEDRSGNGNDWEPIRFGVSNKIDTPGLTGPKPLLNTNEAGNQALPGYFGQDEYRYYTVSSSSGSGNPYIIDDVGTQPTFSFVRGAKYVFDYSSATSHPLRFATAADAAGSSEYTTGTVVSGNTITFCVPHDAPNTLHYYCTNHSGMGNSISVITDANRADPYTQNLVCALPCVGAESGADFYDIAYRMRATTYGGGKSFTRYTGNSDGGGTTTLRGHIYYGSSFFTTRGNVNDNTADYIERTGDNDLSMGTGDYTIEFWYHPYEMNTNDVLIDTRHPTTNWPNDDSGIMIYLNANGSGAMVSNGVQISYNTCVGKNQDNHFALTRSGTTERLFINGKLVGTASNRNNDYNRQRLHLGSSAPNGEGSSGYYNDLRVYKGVCKYTSDFTLGSPNANTISRESPTGVLYSSKLDKITQGAATFDADDYLRVPNHADLRFGSSDFCVEGFVYYTETTGNGSIAGLWNSGSNRRSWLLQIESDQRRLRGFYSLNGSTVVQVNGTTGAMEQCVWHHVALTRSGNTIRLFLNGIQVGTATESGSFYDNSDDDIGVGSAEGGSSSDPITGFLSNVRIVKGSAVYTKNFIPPKDPLTNITNTKLLCCQSNKSANLVTVSPATFSNDGRKWSSGVTFSPSVLNADRGATLAFNGATPDNASTTSNNPANLTVTFTPNLTSVTSLRIFSGSNSSNAYINGASGSTVAITASNWTSLTSLASGASGTISSITILTGGDNAQLAAVEVNGSVLIDNFYGSALLGAGNAGGEYPIGSNFNPFDTGIDTVRGQETVYATLNPLTDSKFQSKTLKNINLDFSGNTSESSGYPTAFSNMTMKAGVGKWYMEAMAFNMTNNAGAYIGICDDQMVNGGVTVANTYSGGPGGIAYGANGTIADNGTNTFTGLQTYNNGDIISVAYDAENGKVYFAKNGEYLQGANPLTGDKAHGVGIIKDMFFTVGAYGNRNIRCNFGQKPFQFPPPDGFVPLAAANVRPEKVIARPDQYVGTILYTGNSSSQRVGGLNMSPDLVWLKSRSHTYDHYFTDTVRGATKSLRPNTTAADDTLTQGLTSFNSDGFSVGNEGQFNNTGRTMVAWCWKAGGNKNTFNVDDLGYANAANVNMNAGALNSVVYNQTQNWSAGGGSGLYSGSTWGPVFDGTPANDGHNIAHSAYVTNSGTSVLTFSTPISGVLTFRACQGSDSTSTGGSRPYVELSNGQIVRVDGGTSNPTHHSFGKVTDITSLTIKGTSAQGMNLIFVKLDGKLLVDTSVTPPNAPSLAPIGCSVGTKQGFSIVQYQGNGSANQSIAHGLTQAPDFSIFKNMDGASNWTIYHKDITTIAQRVLYLNSSGNTADYSGGDSTWWYDFPGPGVFYIGATSTAINNGTNDMISYHWHNVPGLQKFGSYTANGDADGPFVECGFRPAIVIIKRMGSGHWVIMDSTRDTDNPMEDRIKIDSSEAESDTPAFDALSNGFKLRSTYGFSNSGTDTYIYAAWAEVPAMNLFGAQSNAR